MRHIQLSSFLFPAVALWTSSSFALVAPPVCSEDADCAVGQVCQKSEVVGGCATEPVPAGSGGASGVSAPATGGSSNTCAPDVIVSETGYCVQAPVACQSDADCGEYLSCVSGPQDCSASSTGEVVCGDVAVVSTCEVGASESCTADADCPREFACVPLPVSALPEDCGDSCADRPVATNVCQPKEITCQADDECPADWACVLTSSGGSSSGSAGAASASPDVDAPAPLPADPEPTANPVPETIVPAGGASGEGGVSAEGYCLPQAWVDAGVGLGTDGGGTTGGEGDPLPPKGEPGEVGPEVPDGADTDSGESAPATATWGCSVAAKSGGPGGWLTLGAAIAALPLLLRRRRAARP